MNLCEQLDFRYLPDVKARSVSQFLCRKLICLFYNRLKTWLRNRIGEDRLPGLTLMTTSRNKIQETDSEAILNKLALKNPSSRNRITLTNKARSIATQWIYKFWRSIKMS